ncbi:HAD family hydrolase [Flavobacterium sp.]|uniref:HAD family hydrolase n=1 Tax=Flavobacterium sp. TaxID=239 RepID=UPI002638EA87|nr:HAD family hydrolase [Flavobacterium sp.]
MKIEYSHYNHLSFDLWLTLIKSNPEFKKKRNILFKDFFEVDFSIEKVTEIIRYYDLLCNNINEKSGLNIDTFEIYYLVLNDLNVNVSEIEIDRLSEFYKEAEILFMKFKPNLIYPKIQLLFKEIVEQEKTISILSNTAFIKGFTLRKLLLHYELDNYFSFQIYSDETGFSKPSKEIFQLVHNEITSLKSIEKKEVLHIGDNKIADYDGAIKYGFDALLIKI